MIGVPRIIDGGGNVRMVRGKKPWALLARILLADRPLSRRDLSAELFPDADDPLGSLRWCLAELRRALDDTNVFVGDPVCPELPDDIYVDVLDLDGDRLDVGTGNLLDGIDPTWSPQFATWLLVTRQHIASRLDAGLHQRIITALTRGRNDDAVRLAEIAARRSPYDERSHVLLVKGLVANGCEEAALAHVALVEAMFRSELHCEPSSAVRSAASRTVADPPPSIPLATQVQVLLDAGRDALTTGAPDVCIDCFRRAVATAESNGDEALEALALLELGTALIHSVRGFDDEGSVILSRATELAHRTDQIPIAIAALSEHSYADILGGRRHEAAATIAKARELGGNDRILLRNVLAHEAFNLGDWGRHALAIERFDEALDATRAAADLRQEAWVLSVGAWHAVRAGVPERAHEWVERGSTLVQQLRWSSFEPFTTLVKAEVGLAGGPVVSRADLERTFAVSCHLRDPCWEGGAARALALHDAVAGELDSALRWITEGHKRSTRVTDIWAAMIGEILITEATLRKMSGDVRGTDAAAREAVAYAARTHLDDALVRAMRIMQEP